MTYNTAPAVCPFRDGLRVQGFERASADIAQPAAKNVTRTSPAFGTWPPQNGGRSRVTRPWLRAHGRPAFHSGNQQTESACGAQVLGGRWLINMESRSASRGWRRSGQFARRRLRDQRDPQVTSSSQQGRFRGNSRTIHLWRCCASLCFPRIAGGV